MSDLEDGGAKEPTSKAVKAESKLKATAAITMQQELFEELESALDDICSAEAISKVRLQIYQHQADTELENANKYNKNIIGSTRISDKDVQDYLDSKIYKRIKDTYYKITTEITERLEQYKKENPVVVEAPKKSFESEIRLQPLGIPNFSGNYDEWLTFNNLFTSTIHNRTSLEPVQKLQYLFQYVTGDAFKQIKNLTFTNENYEVAREILHDHFYHVRKIAHTYMKKMLDIEPLVNESCRGLREFLSRTKDCLVSLNSLGLPTDHWDYILLFNLQSKIPSITFLKWEESLGSSRDIPKFSDFLLFLENRFRMLEMVEAPAKEKETKKSQQKTLHTKVNPSGSSSSQNVKHVKPTNKPNTKPHGSYAGRRTEHKHVNATCAICNQGHATSQCIQFRNNTPAVRRQLAAQYRLCFNCLGSSHTLDVCYSTKTCVYCKKAHHSLLHLHDHNSANAGTPNPVEHQQQRIPQNQPVQQHQQQRLAPHQHSFYASSDTQSIRILGTALVRIVNSTGYSITVRALLDSGADDNYIVSSTVQNAALKKYSSAAAITGLNDVTVGSTEHKVNLQIQSMDGTFSYDTSASVVNTITSKMPTEYVEPENFGFLNNLPLADPHFNHPGKIHLLLGVGFVVKIRKPGLKRFKDLLAEQTLLGWIVMGQCSTDTSQTTLLTRNVFLTKSVNNEDLSKQIQKFFEIEEFSEKIPQKPEDVLCEKKFVESIRQADDGKLIVELPFRETECPMIGPSRHIAMRRFLNLEKRLENNPALKKEYSQTITEYLQEGHLLPVTNASKPGFEYFLPHHAVIKESSTTTKVRVVFDGSCKSADSTSLNDHLLTGPKLQTDIRDIFFNWRKYRYALTADIAKMYRMFWVDEKHRNYQKILWRFSRDEPISEFCLATVTFGTSSAPFQAIRALHYIAETEKAKYPLASKALLSEFYVDDFISGAHSIPEAIQKQTQLRDVLNQYGLNIRKWSSNSLQALHGINTELKETLTELSFEEEEFRKTLGVYWSPKGDFFSFSTSHFKIEEEKLTKRAILSLIARLYDPMGWVGPCTLHAKMIMQRIWEQNLSWDEEVCGNIKTDFEKFIEDLPQLTNLKFPRWIQIQDETSPVTLYGFSDASLKAYGAVLYLKNPKSDDPNNLILLTSRTRVKPLKHITLARLELCAAVMLAELIDWAKKLFEPHPVTIFAFSDSKIVLSWIKSHPSRWKMYVAGRTTKILEFTTADEWSYINTKHNPADLASRGLLPSELIDNNLWWNGPNLDEISQQESHTVLSQEDADIIHTEVKETKTVLHTINTKNTIYSLVEKFSSHGKMCNVIGYITAFIKDRLLFMKNKYPQKSENYQQIIQKVSSPETLIYILVQRSTFHNEIKALENRQPIPKQSQLNSLNPFLDGFGVLRVGGRLENALMSYNYKYPIILPSHHQVTTNLIHLAHHATLHGPNTLTAAYLRSKFHIIRGTDRIKTLLKKCPRCIKFAKERHEQLMGSLPKDRVNPYRPFLCAGVDYAGPFTLKAYKGRCNKTTKGYVALFVCFCTKALHLELVSDLTATSFLAAFRRFVSRRGFCQTLYSDCGTNFVKGNKLLIAEIDKAQISWKTELTLDFESMGTKWEFNPPGTPHFGGLWEAGVKSMKTHLNKTFGNITFTPEEFNTVLIQIEGILNSRPLCPLSTDPLEFSSLTPAHFLIGEAIVAPPDRCYDLEAKHPIDRWQFLQKLRQMFWVSWKRDYLHRLNSRPKWKQEGIVFKKDDIVILTEENTPATYWPTAIILETHPGRDGITRVVTLKTNKGQIFKRPTSKLRLLAYNSEDFQLNYSTEN